ncbi:PQQ-binding-like beta-propeller repeat protein [Bacteroides sp. UBA939]|uniref:PQQ-binding-like beta-propeller repeat protein n=1 Tax=Bacteroides sp. UBA939 TaxID=1946092 RepID=UPI0025BA9753|nr:PQQ-binding-like beta-propeller repeat protein [Bacteroides sp. UBA939]
MKAKNKVRFLIGMLVVLNIFGQESKAQDWPQWRGENRSGISKESGLNLDWANKTPSLSWVFRQAGTGYSSPSIVGTTLYCQGAMDGNGFAFALDTQTGNLKWKQGLGEESVPDRENCPRGSVTVDGDKLYLIRGIGQIHCLSATDGKVLWQKDFVGDFNGKYMSRWGYSESPLVDGDLVICTPGGTDGTLVALNKNTGEVAWRTKEWTDEAGYSSPIVIEVDGMRQYIQQSAKGVAGVSAKDGKLLWCVEIPGYRTAVIPTPIYDAPVVYVTAGYNAGSTCIRLTKEGDGMKAETLYSNKNMVNQHGGVVLMDGHIYGHSDNSGWTCQNLETGEKIWSQRNREGVTRGSVVGVDNHLILLDERSGKLAVVAASPEGWKEVSRMEFPERTQIQTTDNMIWAHPVIANGKLYLRDHDLLFCLNLSK